MTIPPEVLTEMGRQAPQAQTQQVAVACNAFCWLFDAIAEVTCQKKRDHGGKHKADVETANPSGQFTITWTQLHMTPLGTCENLHGDFPHEEGRNCINWTPEPSPGTEPPENPDFDRGYDVGWQDAKDDGFDRDKLARAIEDYMSSGGHEFRAYDLADCIIRHLVGEMKL